VKAAFLASAALLLAASGCATSTAIDLDGGQLDGNVKTDGSKTDGSTNKDSGSQGQCVPSCSTDQDCENSCPMVPNGVNCCDTSTGICYAYAATACPAGGFDAGFD
jgi:hypothetical protein